MIRPPGSGYNLRGHLRKMMRPTLSPWFLAAAFGAAVACGGVSHEDFYDGPAQKAVQTGGSGGTLGGSTGIAANGGVPSSAGTGGTPGTGGAVSASGGSAASGGTGNSPAVGGSGDAPAMGGSGDATGVGGTSSGDGGAGDAPNSGTGGTSLAGMGGATSTGGMAGSGGGLAGDGGTGNVGGASAGMGGLAGSVSTAGRASGGRGGRGGGDDCATRLADLADLLETAQACNRASDARTCTAFVKNECGCKVPVNSGTSSATKAYSAAIEDLGTCVECAEGPCPPAEEAACQSTGSGSQGRCVVSGPQATF